MRVWTLTVDNSDEIVTSVHLSEDSAVNALFQNYDDESEFDRGDIQPLLDAYGLIVHIDAHEIEVTK